MLTVNLTQMFLLLPLSSMLGPVFPLLRMVC